MEISVREGDIAAVSADVMITAINSGGAWFGGIDQLIQNYAGSQYHAAAKAKMPLEDGQTVVARQKTSHKGAWGDVLFVVDDLRLPLNQLVERALTAADQAGYETVSMPAIRTGVMLGVKEKTAAEAATLLMDGVRRHRERGTGIKEVTIVVFRDPKLFNLLR